MVTFTRNWKGGPAVNFGRFSIFSCEKMRKDEHKTREPKGVYRVRNWSAYNAGLIARGDVTMWIDKSVLKQDTELESRKRGRPCVYSDAVIQMLLGLKQVFRLPLRALQGFACSLRKLAFADLPVPIYTS